MQYDLQEMSAGEVYSLMIRAITPRPIAWVSTCSSAGVENLAPFSYFNGVCSAPPALSFSPVNKPDGSKKDTVVNIEETGQFVVNMVPHSLVQQMHQSSAAYDSEISEIETLGLERVDSIRIKPPRVALSPIQFECELIKIVEIGAGPFAANLIIGQILLAHVNDSVLNSDGKIDPDQVDLIGRMGGIEYARTTERFGIPPAQVEPV